MTMRFRTRAFLICFVPVVFLLVGSFWLAQRFVQRTVLDNVRFSLRENQLAMARVQARSDTENNRFLRAAGENAALKAGMLLLSAEASNPSARRTVEDQLSELGEHMGFDLLEVSSPDGKPLAALTRTAVNTPLSPADLASLDSTQGGWLLLHGRVLHVGSVPIDSNRENLGTLTVGEYFDFSEFATPVVLLAHGKVVAANVPGLSLADLSSSLASCTDRQECELRAGGIHWISLPMQGLADGDGYMLRSMENVDAVTSPVQARLRRLFAIVLFVSVLLIFATSVVSSRSIVRPLSVVIEHLKNTTWTGDLPPFHSGELSPIVEVRELAESYNSAAAAVRKERDNLQRAYLEFIGSLASALDARDPYTSGHSHRVSQLSCALAHALQLPEADIERIRVGALLHDIGKIGISDTVLQKPGRLTEEEFALIKLHPVIGRVILEGVQGFAPYLGAVELHHENWDGTGYPLRLSGENVPIDARIIHVADAYDAMTTTRSYRSGMTHERAFSILRECAGTQFDPHLVALFLELAPEVFAALPPTEASLTAAERTQAVEAA